MLSLSGLGFRCGVRLSSCAFIPIPCLLTRVCDCVHSCSRPVLHIPGRVCTGCHPSVPQHRPQHALCTSHSVIVLSSVMVLSLCSCLLPLALECMYVWMDEWMNGWMDGWMDGWMNGWMDGWMDIYWRVLGTAADLTAADRDAACNDTALSTCAIAPSLHQTPASRTVLLSPAYGMYVCMHGCMHVCMYVSMYLCICVSMYVYMYVCISWRGTQSCVLSLCE